ncbi:unnamed protein product, partial [Staurois parvus]
MRGPGRPDIVNAGSGESGYTECKSGYSKHIASYQPIDVAAAFIFFFLGFFPP